MKFESLNTDLSLITGEPYIETLNRGLLLANADGWGCPCETLPASLNRDLLLTLPSARILE